MENFFGECFPPWIETGLQPAFYDKESGTVLQQTARMYARVNMLSRMFNKLSKNTKTTVEDYINQFNELHDYVHDYFDNLDVQEEINNKLDAMVEDGSFQPLLDITFNQYFNQMKTYTDNALESKVDKNGTGQITYNNLSQSVKEMFTGGSVAVVGANSVGNGNIVDNSISYQKLSENGKNGVAGYNQIKTLTFGWEQGSRHNAQGELIDVSNTIVITEPFSLKMGLRIKVNDGYKAAVYTHDVTNNGSVAWFMWSGFDKKDYFIGNNFNPAHLNKQFYISIRKSDDSDLTPSEGFDAVTVTEPQSNIKPSYGSLDADTQHFINGKTTTFHFTDSFTVGSVADTTREGILYPSGVASSSMNRAFLSTPIFLPKGTTLASTDGWEFIIVKASSVPTMQKVTYPEGQGWQTSIVVPYDDVFYIQYRYEDNSGLYDTGGEFISHFTATIPASTGSNKVMYVSGIGNDSTGDGSYSSPYREINKAISEGATTIFCAFGYKYTPLNLDKYSNIRIVGTFPTYGQNNQIQSKPYFDNSIILDTGTVDGTSIKIPYTATEVSDMYKCLVAKTKNLEDGTSTRSEGYYCTIYSDGNQDTSHRYIPVLTRDSVEGHFYYDGTYIYINPYSSDSVSSEFSLVDYGMETVHDLVTMTNCDNITFENFTFKHATGRLLYANKTSGLKVVNCDFRGSSQNDNLGVIDTNIDLINCTSYLARNDGFNFHGFGESLVVKCIGANCFDDGISHHNKCNHTIIGGEYYGNGKGGISSPTYGCSSDIHGCYVHNNPAGIHTGSDNTYGDSYINLSNNLIVGNNVGVRLSKCIGVAFNNTITNNNTNIVNNSSVVVY